LVQSNRALFRLEVVNREIQTRVTFRTRSSEEAREILSPLHVEADVSTYIQSVTFLLKDERYDCLITALSRQGLSHNEYRNWVFEDRELAEAKLLHMIQSGYWGYPQPENDYKSESYDMSEACPICGKPAKQIKPYLVKGPPKFGRNDILALNWTYEFIVTDRLRTLIEDAELEGAEFWPLLNFKARTPLSGYMQLRVVHDLPPMSKSTLFKIVSLRGVKTPCSCGRLGLMLERVGEHGPVSLPRFDRGVLNHAKDFNLTHEWLSEGFDANQWKIVSPRVYRLFKAHNIKGVRFEPVVIEG